MKVQKRYGLVYISTIENRIRTEAYLLAEKDNFIKTPQYYWFEAENKILTEFFTVTYKD